MSSLRDIDRGLDLLGYDEDGRYHPERDTSPAELAPFSRPADALLLRLRELRGNAYVNTGASSWLAWCPACGDLALRISESGYGGPVSADCRNCADGEVLAAIAGGSR